MGLLEDLDGAKSNGSKIPAWLDTLELKEREAFLEALRQPNSRFSTASLLEIALRAGCDTSESAMRRYRTKVRRESGAA